MVKKKVRTLACAVGILACGACFNTWGPPTPPLAPRIKSNGVHSIDVEVTNVSESQHIDPSTLARLVAESVNAYSEDTKVKAHARSDARSEDTVLKITILDESAVRDPSRVLPSDMLPWSIDLNLSATLKQKDGQVLWQEKENHYRVQSWSKAVDTTYPWKDPSVSYSLSYDVIRGMLFAELQGN